MELGLSPDDDSLFEEVTEKSQKLLYQQSCCIKNCYPLVIEISALHMIFKGKS